MTDCRLVRCSGLGQDEYGVVYTYPGMPGAPETSWWQQLISGGVKTAEQIALAKTQTKGVLTQTAPGVFTYVQPEGTAVTLPVGTTGFQAAATPGFGLVLVGGAALLGLLLLLRR